MNKAELLVYLFDISITTPTQLKEELLALPHIKQTILVANKAESGSYTKEEWPENTVFISAKNKDIETLVAELERVASHYEFGMKRWSTMLAMQMR